VEHVERIRGSARHLLRLIEQILSFSRMEAGIESVDVTPISVGAIVREVTGIVEPLAQGKDLTLIVELPEPDYSINTDIGKLEQILLNLLSNAVKFTPQGKIELNVLPADTWSGFLSRSGKPSRPARARPRVPVSA
jgi:signal transduction histidine kinase